MGKNEDRLVMKIEDRFFQECVVCKEPLYLQVSSGSFVIKGDSTQNRWGLK